MRGSSVSPADVEAARKCGIKSSQSDARRPEPCSELSRAERGTGCTHYGFKRARARNVLALAISTDPFFSAHIPKSVGQKSPSRSFDPPLVPSPLRQSQS